MDLQTMAYFIKTNRDGMADECKEMWRGMQNLEYPYLHGADNVIYEYKQGERHETDDD